MFLLQGCTSVVTIKNTGSFDYLKYELENEKMIDDYERFYVCMGDLYTKSYFSSSFSKAPLQIAFNSIDISISDLDTSFKDIGFLKRNHFFVIDSNKIIKLKFEIKKLNETKQLEINPKKNERTFIKLDLYSEQNELNCNDKFCTTSTSTELFITSSSESALCNNSNFGGVYKKIQ
jgi:hypothetical protein